VAEKQENAKHLQNLLIGVVTVLKNQDFIENDLRNRYTGEIKGKIEMEELKNIDNFELRALHFAQEKHLEQKDDDGNPYVEHCLRVASAVQQITDKENVIAAAYLHDTIEDTDTTYEELVEYFNKEVANLVMEVTHEGTYDAYGYYFPRLKSADAIIIKLCDRADNINRMSSWDDKRKSHYLKKTKFWKDGSDRRNRYKVNFTISIFNQNC
jgi:(p)ppGpp synthase/HD superfamily hydrolase